MSQARHFNNRSASPRRQCALTPIVFVAWNTNTGCIEIGGAMTADTPPQQTAEAA